MTIKEAVYALSGEDFPLHCQYKEAQRVLFENRVVLTGEACPVCSDAWRSKSTDFWQGPASCAHCYGSGRELARVWPPEMAEPWFGRPVRSAPVEHRVWFTAEGFANAVDRVLDWANHRRRFAREAKRQEAERDPFVNAQR